MIERPTARQLRRLGVAAVLLAAPAIALASSAATAPPTDPVATAMAISSDCAPTESGTDYAVGPGQAYESIGDVPWPDLAAGDSVRIFWRDEPYREKFLVQGQGTEAQPIVVCGVAGPAGELPVIGGDGATTSPDMGYASVAGQARGLIHISLGGDDEWGYKPSYIVIQGLHLRNASYQNQFTDSDGTTGTDVLAVEGEEFTIDGSTTSADPDPLFTDPQAGDYSLQPDSPAAGRGAFL